MAGRKNFPNRCESRRNKTLERQEARNKLDVQQQLNKLDEKLGIGVGAVKERLRLQGRIK